ncbi:MAG: 50S ribosomal protein L9 [Gammaproteobacteria bacterium]|nr:50S ribosomal protein L9 [Gammaproteobacteria bacterium]|tara:strand:- start:1393 stop:1842 length:450 start_codon:yes stop_codon:yes gene_type:complete
MEVILLETIGKLGDLGDKVTVSSGYGRNFLIPKKKAVPATAANLEIFEGKRAELEKNAKARLQEANKRGEQIADLVLNLTAKAGDEGKLFGSITVRDIVDACFSKGIEVEKSEIKLPEGPIRNTGDFEVGVQVHPDLIVKMKVTVSAEV